MNTKHIFYNKRKSESDYFRSICAGAKSMENTTLFYYNNTISGLRKSPEQRYHNETEVLHYVFTGISLYNRQKIQNFEDKVIKAGELLANGEISGSKARNMVCAMLPDDIGTEKHTLLVVKMKAGNDLLTCNIQLTKIHFFPMSNWTLFLSTRIIQFIIVCLHR